MKIAVMGAGALGCYFGGRLQEKGADIAYIARGAHLEALKREGLKVESPLGDIALPTVTATDDPAEIGPVDMVWLLVKMQDTDAALAAMGPLLGPDTAVLSFQNGVEAWERIGQAVGRERVIGGTAAIPADIREPGVIRHSAPFARLVIGEFDGSESPRLSTLATMLREAGVDVTVSPEIEVKIWEKFVMLSAFSGVTSLTRLPIGPIRDNPESFELLRRAAAETMAVGRAICPALPESHYDTVMRFFTDAPAAMRSSLFDDLSRGKRLEVPFLSGAVARLGGERGIPTPTHDTIARALAPYVDGAPTLPG